MSITREEVFAAIERLVQGNQQLTLQRVREELGNRGSFATISNHVRAWKAGQREQAVLEDEEIPHDLKIQSAQYLKVLWRTASEVIEKEVSSVKRVAQQQVEDAEQDAQEALVEIESLQVRYEKLERDYSELKSTSEKTSTELYSVSQLLEQSRDLHNREKLQRKEAGEELWKVSEKLREVVERAATAEARVQGLEGELARERSKVDNLEVRIRELSEKLTDEARVSGALKEKVSSLEEKLARALEGGRHD